VQKLAEIDRTVLLWAAAVEFRPFEL